MDNPFKPGDRVEYADVNLYLSGYHGTVMDVAGSYAFVQWEGKHAHPRPIKEHARNLRRRSEP